jgi:DNA polymerase
VASDGNKINPKVLILGEAPGKDEVEAGKPFVGRAGKLLRSSLNQYGFNKNNSLISNIIPCRPENNKFPTNIDLVKDCFNNWLLKEIILTKPDVMLLLGAQPLKYILNMVGITKLRGQWYDFKAENGNVLCMPTYHPSYVLRKEYMSEGKLIKDNFLNDIKAVAEKSGLKFVVK